MAFALPLCRCFCGNKDEFDAQKVLDTTDGEQDRAQSRRRVPAASQGHLSYVASTDQPLRGVPIREGTLWLLSAEEEVASITLLLHVNGFTFTHAGREHTFAFSPFALVRNCKFQATVADAVDLGQYACFKVSLFTQGACFYFGVRATTKADMREAEEERTRWVTDLSRAMRLVTQSLFPPFQIACAPLEAAPLTKRRIMAGYLLHHDDVSITSVLYCELHPQISTAGALGHAKIVVYEDETCQAVVMEIRLTERSTCCEKVGISCSCFSVEDHLFSSRTLLERRLWMRAISNVKVKLQNQAESPDEQELQQYRGAIQAHLRSHSAELGRSQAPTDPLLQLHRRTSMHASPLEHHIPNRTRHPPPLPGPVDTAGAARASAGQYLEKEDAAASSSAAAAEEAEEGASLPPDGSAL